MTLNSKNLPTVDFPWIRESGNHESINEKFSKLIPGSWKKKKKNSMLMISMRKLKKFTIFFLKIPHTYFIKIGCERRYFRKLVEFTYR